MQLTERRLRSLIRMLLEADAPPGNATPTTPPMDAPIEMTSAEKDAKAREQGLKTDFDDELADLLAKKMRDKGATDSSVSDMRKAVADGR